jgi:tetratricopeptide (TPR) repeat protein
MIPAGQRLLPWLMFLIAAVPLASADSTNLIEAADRLFRSQDYKSALTILENVEADDPAYVDALCRIGYAHEKMGNIGDALEAYVGCVQEADTDAAAGRKLHDRAEAAIKRLDNARALVIRHAAALERDAKRYRPGTYNYDKTMAVVEQMRAAFPPLVASDDVDRGRRKAIRDRNEALHEALIRNDFEEAITYVDPEMRQRSGDNAVKGFLKLAAGMLRLWGVKEGGIHIGGLDFSRDGEAARVVARFRVHGAWRNGDPAYWVRRSGKWYIGDEKELAKRKF